MLRRVRKAAAVLLMTGLLALAACGGGGGSTVTLTVTATGKPSATSTASTRTAAASPVPQSAIADAAAVVATPVGGAVLAPAAVAAAATPSAGAKATGAGRKAAAPVPPSVTANSATGQYAVAHTNGTFRHPSRIVLKINASPPQTGSVFWTLVCSETSNGVGHEQAHTTTKLPTSETLPIPAPSNYCIASANVQLSNSGTVSISITG